jgi:hypothetical protein
MSPVAYLTARTPSIHKIDPLQGSINSWNKPGQVPLHSQQHMLLAKFDKSLVIHFILQECVHFAAIICPTPVVLCHRWGVSGMLRMFWKSWIAQENGWPLLYYYTCFQHYVTLILARTTTSTPFANRFYDQTKSQLYYVHNASASEGPPSHSILFEAVLTKVCLLSTVVCVW